MKRISALLAAFLVMASPAWATDWGANSLPDAKQEARARQVFSNLRCVVCAGQSVADSNAEVARDMRRYVREQVLAGVKRDDIIRNIAATYGDDILLKPPVSATTYALWFGPPLFMFLGLAIAIAYFASARMQRKR